MLIFNGYRPVPIQFSSYIYITKMLVMKAVLTLFFVFNLGATALANTETDDRIDGFERGIDLVAGSVSIDAAPQIKVRTENGVARLYKFQNSRIKKALEFATKHSKAKWV